MAFLNTIISFFGTAIAPDILAPSKMWHVLILKTFGFIADYGWRIVVFTLILKLVLSPLDFFQRYKMNKNQKITERLKPTMEKIQRQYGADKQAFSQKQMELNRREGYSYFSSCLPMIATMVVFITLWLSMSTVASYMTFREYATLYDGYNVAYEQVSDLGEEKAKAVSQDVVYTMYYNGINDQTLKDIRERNGLDSSFTLEKSDKLQASFLWVKNIWSPDVPWGKQSVLDWDSFKKATSSYATTEKSGLSAERLGGLYSSDTYERVMYKLLNDETVSRTNGYLVLPVMVLLLSVGSQLLSVYQQKRAGQVNNKGGVATSLKVMMFVMPVMMVAFAVQNASIFTLYMVVNSATSLIFNFAFSGILKLMERVRTRRHNDIRTGSPRSVPGRYGDIIHYVKGANPNAGQKAVAAISAGGAVGAENGKKSKKEKNKTAPTTVKSGRPDPNDLLNYGSSDERGRKR